MLQNRILKNRFKCKPRTIKWNSAFLDLKADPKTNLPKTIEAHYHSIASAEAVFEESIWDALTWLPNPKCPVIAAFIELFNNYFVWVTGSYIFEFG